MCVREFCFVLARSHKEAMWSHLSKSAQEWETALAAEQNRYDNSVITASANAICAARRFNEIFIGGDETPCLIQLLCGAKEAAEAAGEAIGEAVGEAAGEGGVDMLASVLLPSDEVEITYTVRGADAAKLVASFWNEFPLSPALLQSQGAYHRLMCEMPAGGWTQGVLCPAHLRVLQQSATFASEALRVYVPGESRGAAVEDKRAAVRRPSHEVLDAPESEAQA